MRSLNRSTKLVIYCRLPGLLAQAARRARPASDKCCPLAVTEGRFIRSVCPLAARVGIKPAISVIHARRLCPILLTVPVETVAHQPDTSAFLDILADLTPQVEPDGPDAAYAVLSSAKDEQSLIRRITEELKLPLIFGVGVSRLAARACAECCLPPECLPDAAADWLWPEDCKVVAALKRLGLDTFGQVAAVGEDALFYQFGRIGRLLHRRSLGQDLTLVRPVYPPPRADVRHDCEDYPIEDRQRLNSVLSHISGKAATELLALGKFGRRVVLRVTTEKTNMEATSGEEGELRRAWSLPAPVQAQGDVLRASQRLLGQMTISAPITFLRLLVEDLEIPRALTADLFARGPGDDPLALEAVRRSLIARFGLRSVSLASHLPVSLRQERRACLREKWAVYR